jgi:hypothetical protein
MRLKADGSLDLDWREARRPWWMKTVEQRKAELMATIRRNYPNLTREEAQEMLDQFFRLARPVS